MINDILKERIKSILKLYENPQSSILALLHEIQKQNGWIEENDIDELSNITQIPYSKIKSVLTFYTMYNQKKVGKFHMQICRNISCHMMSSKKLIEFIRQKLNIEEGEITPDGLFSYTTVECLGACGNAPVIMVNDRYYENLNEEKLEKLIEDLKKEL